MEIKGRVFCLYEQSGVFKNEFKKLGYLAYDMDIQNNFGETDYQVDLFAEIEKAYDSLTNDNSQPSLLDAITTDDLTLAFMPCIYFSANNSYIFDGTWQTYKQRGMTQLEINQVILERSRERQRFYEIALKMFTYFDVTGKRLIVENPYSKIHYLHNNFPYKPALIDKNRQLRGDYFAKPTQYWFVNCEPTHGFTRQEPTEKRNVYQLSGHTGNLCDEDRSMIAPEYCRNFICDNILGKAQALQQLSLFD